MKKTTLHDALLHIGVSARIAVITMLICSGAYPLVILGFARFIAPETAEGSLIRDDKGMIRGSRLIAQEFRKPEYFWPRPSAVAYNAAGAAGSNFSPASTQVRSRAEQTALIYRACKRNPLPADLAAASGSGLDPCISLKAALYQVPRVAKSRGLMAGDVAFLVHRHSEVHSPFPTGGSLVNVLELNMELDGVRNSAR